MLVAPRNHANEIPSQAKKALPVVDGETGNSLGTRGMILDGPNLLLMPINIQDEMDDFEKFEWPHSSNSSKWK